MQNRHVLAGGLLGLTLAACASAPDAPERAPVIAAPPPPEGAGEALLPSEYDRAMASADDLTAAGNEQAAIDRLTALLGNRDLSQDERVRILWRRAELRYGPGNDVWGAINDLDELLNLAPEHPLAASASDLRNIARGEATSLNFVLETGEISRMERFELLFRLGQHQDAVDDMLAFGLQPGNAHLLDLYQMGYLCDGGEFTGPAYELEEPDGTLRTVQFCDFGK